MQVFSARVHAGVIVIDEGISLPEGTVVTVIADDGEVAFEVSPEEEVELLEAVAEVERGETITVAELLERLRR